MCLAVAQLKLATALKVPLPVQTCNVVHPAKELKCLRPTGFWTGSRNRAAQTPTKQEVNVLYLYKLQRHKFINFLIDQTSLFLFISSLLYILCFLASPTRALQRQASVFHTAYIAKQYSVCDELDGILFETLEDIDPPKYEGKTRLSYRILVK